LTIIKTTIIYGTIITRALLCTVHESKSQRDVQIYGVSSPPSHCTGYRAPSSKKNEHTPDNLRGKCPMIFPVFFYSHGIDLLTFGTLCGSYTPALLQQLPLTSLYIHVSCECNNLLGTPPRWISHPLANVLKV